jgi:hypothetical protein
MGGTKTEASEEFKTLVADTERRKLATEALSESCGILIFATLITRYIRQHAEQEEGEQGLIDPTYDLP